MRGEPRNFTASGLLWTGDGSLVGLLIGMDNANDPQITIYDGLDSTGTQIVPTTNLDASAKGFNGFMPGDVHIPFRVGCYVLVELSGGGAWAFTMEGIAYIASGQKS